MYRNSLFALLAPLVFLALTRPSLALTFQGTVTYTPPVYPPDFDPNEPHAVVDGYLVYNGGEEATPYPWDGSPPARALPTVDGRRYFLLPAGVGPTVLTVDEALRPGFLGELPGEPLGADGPFVAVREGTGVDVLAIGYGGPIRPVSSCKGPIGTLFAFNVDGDVYVVGEPPLPGPPVRILETKGLGVLLKATDDGFLVIVKEPEGVDVFRVVEGMVVERPTAASTFIGPDGHTWTLAVFGNLAVLTDGGSLCTYLLPGPALEVEGDTVLVDAGGVEEIIEVTPTGLRLPSASCDLGGVVVSVFPEGSSSKVVIVGPDGVHEYTVPGSPIALTDGVLLCDTTSGYRVYEISPSGPVSPTLSGSTVDGRPYFVFPDGRTVVVEGTALRVFTLEGTPEASCGPFVKTSRGVFEVSDDGPVAPYAWDGEVAVFPDGEVVWCAGDRPVAVGTVTGRVVKVLGSVLVTEDGTVYLASSSGLTVAKPAADVDGVELALSDGEAVFVYGDLAYVFRLPGRPERVSKEGDIVVVETDGGPAAFEVLPSGVRRPDSGGRLPDGGYGFLFGDTVVVVDDGNVVSYRIEGDVRWPVVLDGGHVELLTSKGPEGPSWVVDGNVYVFKVGNSTWLVEASDGNVGWVVSVPGEPVYAGDGVVLVKDGDGPVVYLVRDSGPVRASEVGCVEGVLFFAGGGELMAVEGDRVEKLGPLDGPVSVCRDVVAWLGPDGPEAVFVVDGEVKEPVARVRIGASVFFVGPDEGGRFDVVGWENGDVCYFEVEGRFVGVESDLVLYEEDGSLHRLELITPSLVVKLVLSGFSSRVEPAGSASETAGASAVCVPFLPFGRRPPRDPEGRGGRSHAVADVDHDESGDAGL